MAAEKPDEEEARRSPRVSAEASPRTGSGPTGTGEEARRAPPVSPETSPRTGSGPTGTEKAMRLALDEAEAAAARGEVPVGAVVLREGVILARAGNEILARDDPTAHAEMLVIRAAAAALGSQRLAGADLYVTLEPCPMCAAAIGLARISRLYFAAYDAKGGGVEHGPRIFDQPTCHHRPEVYGGIAERTAGDLLRRFFRARR
jgi:tRNA(adenine34) deaminase